MQTFGPYTLAKHQLEYRTTYINNGALFAYGDTGVGKTTGLLWAAQGHEGPVVIVSRSAAQNSVWGREIRLTTGQKMCALATRDAPIPDPLPKYTFISWGNLQFLAPRLIDATPKGSLLVIFDESHRAKDHRRFSVHLNDVGKPVFTPKDNTTYWAAQLSRHAKGRMIATAWPMPNSVTELWAQLDIMLPGAWGSYRQFASRYSVAEKTEYGVKYSGKQNMAELKRRLEPYMVRTHVKDIVGMGFPAVITERIDLDAPQKISAAAMKRAGLKVKDVEELMQGVRAGKYTAADVETLIAENVQRKFPAFKAHLRATMEDFPKLKGIVFVTRVDHVEKLCALLSPSIACIGVHAGTPDRDGKRADFWAHPGPALFICTGQSEGESSNLQCVSHMFFLHLPYTVTELIQWRGRGIRAGATTGTVFEQYLMVPGALDTRLLEIQLGKLDAVNGLDTFDASFLNTMADTLEGSSAVGDNLLDAAMRFE